MADERRGASAGEAGESWRRLFEAVAELEAEMEALCEGRPRDRAEGGRYLSRLLASGLSRFSGRRTLSIDYDVPRIGGFNPDYRFGHATLDPRASYVIRGALNDVHRIALGTYRGMLASSAPVGHVTREDLQADGRGRFELHVSDEPPEASVAGAGRAWLRKSPETSSLVVRQLVLRLSDRPAELSIERVGPGPAEETPAWEEWDARRQRESLDGTLLFVVGAARHFFRWTKALAPLRNRIAHVPGEIEAEVKADPDTFYAVGYFDLDEDESLEVRFTPPPCDYWGLQTTNHWLEPIEHPSLVTHRNQATAESAPDGSVTLVISPRGDAGPNPLHTLGHRNGGVFFRVIGAEGADVSLPSCRVRRR